MTRRGWKAPSNIANTGDLSGRLLMVSPAWASGAVAHAVGIPRAAPLFQGSATRDPLQQVQRRTHAGRRQRWIVFIHHGAGAADRCIGSAFALLNKHSSPTMARISQLCMDGFAT